MPGPQPRPVPPAGRATRGPLHMIGNAHIDPVWLWPWQEGYQEARATFRVRARPDGRVPRLRLHLRLRRATCDWVEESDPAAVRAHPRAGRRRAAGEIVGGWWVEPDCNIPGGECVRPAGPLRPALPADRFGATATVGCNVDPFGHNAVLPQILAKPAWTPTVPAAAVRTRRRCPDRRSGGTPPTAPACWRTGSRTSTAPRAATSARTSTRRSRSSRRTTEPLMVLLRRRQPRRRPDQGQHRQHRSELDARDQFPQHRAVLAGAASSTPRTARRPPGVRRGAPAPRASAATRRTRGSSSWNRRAEHAAAARGEVGGGRGRGDRPRIPATGQLERRVEAGAVQPVPRHGSPAPRSPSAYDDARDQLGEARSIAARLQNRAIQSDQPTDRHPRRRRDDAAGRVQPAPVAGATDGRGRVRGTAVGKARMVGRRGCRLDRCSARARSTTIAGGRRRLVVPVDVPAARLPRSTACTPGPPRPPTAGGAPATRAGERAPARSRSTRRPAGCRSLLGQGDRRGSGRRATGGRTPSS